MIEFFFVTLAVARRIFKAHEIALFNACSRNVSENQRFCNIVRIADGGESKRWMKFVLKNVFFCQKYDFYPKFQNLLIT